MMLSVAVAIAVVSHIEPRRTSSLVFPPAGAAAASSAGWRTDLAGSIERMRRACTENSVLASWTIGFAGMPLDGGGPQVAWGEFRFWYSGGRFASAFDADPRLGLSAPLEESFDGAVFSLFDRRDNVLINEPALPRQSHMGVPNPFMLTWDFLNPDSDSCDGCALRVSDLGDPSALDRALRSANLIDASPSGEELRVEFAGDKLDGLAFRHRVTFTGKPGHRLPTRIERVTDSGGVLTTISLADYTAHGPPVNPQWLPGVVSLDIAGGATVTFAVTSVVVGAPGTIGLERMGLQSPRAGRVWDGARRVMLRGETPKSP